MAVDVKEVEPIENYLGPAIFKMTSDKLKTVYTAVKSQDGYAFYEIKVDKGSLPKELKGKFSSHQRAIERFKSWEAIQEKSKTVQRDNRAEAREQEKKLNADQRAAS